MKRFTRLVSSTLAAALLLSSTAVAAGTNTITINDSTEGNTYVAYQIFAGEADGSVLTNIAWGEGVSAAGQTALGTASDVAATLTNTADAEEFASEVAEYLTVPSGSDSTVDGGVYAIENLEPGYYLIKNTAVADGEAFTSYILKVVNDVTVNPKDDSVPTLDKTVADNDGDTDTESADYAIGDDVPFTLTATLPSNVSDYEEYKLVFTDNLSAGLTYNNDAKVYIDGTEVTATISADAGVITITLDDAKALGATDNSVVTVEYTAELNENAVIGGEGNLNTADLEYYNNPNFDYNGDGEGENGKTDTDGDGDVDEDDTYDNDGDGDVDEDDGDTDGDGDVDEDDQIETTPEDSVVVFTYELDVNKVDSSNAALEGAGFTLYKKNGEGNYVQIGSEITGVTTFEFEGLDAGEYKLVESTTPDGYNTMGGMEFTISSTHTEAGFDLTSSLGTAATITDGTITTDVVNYSGTELPETGGMGTRVIYTLGGALVLGATVLLVTRRRMSN